MISHQRKNILEAFGKQIEIIRKDKNLSYRKMAQYCNVDYSDISKIEKGKINIQLLTIIELARGLEVHPKELFDYEFDLQEGFIDKK